jgi:hypothetical protein
VPQNPYKSPKGTERSSWKTAGFIICLVVAAALLGGDMGVALSCDAPLTDTYVANRPDLRWNSGICKK